MDVTDTSITFIWGSEDTGFRHLYLITSSLVQSANGVKESMVTEQNDCINLVPSIISKVRVIFSPDFIRKLKFFYLPITDRVNVRRLGGVEQMRMGRHSQKTSLFYRLTRNAIGETFVCCEFGKPRRRSITYRTWLFLYDRIQ